MRDVERRNALRAPITVSVVEQNQIVEQEVLAVNISEYGMQYQKPVDAQSCKGQEVFLTFSLLDEGKPIRLLGWVVQETLKEDYINTHVTFMFLPTKEGEIIRDFVNVNGVKVN